MKDFFSSLKQSSRFVLYVLGFVFTLRIAFPSYVGSSFLGTLISNQFLGLVYVFCSIIALVIFIYMPNILRRYGNYKTIMFLAMLDTLGLLGLAVSKNLYFLLTCFVVTYSTTLFIGFCLDIFIEHNSTNNETGKIRSTYLTGVNFAWLISPWLASMLVGTADYWKVYFAATCIMIPILFIISYNLKDFVDPEYKEFHFLDTLREVSDHKNIKCILAVNFILQFFYAWMIIYAPIYLHQYIGFSWPTIGIIFTIMLLPFVLIQIPLGKLADTRLGEKEILSYGLIIMSLSVTLMAIFHSQSLLIWILLLFMTRVGAAMVEVMSDIYFFKQIGEKNINLISLYRTMIPFAYVVSPIIATLFLCYFPLSDIFFLLALLLLFGLRYSLALKDTR